MQAGMLPCIAARNSRLIRRLCQWDVAVSVLLIWCCISLGANFGHQLDLFSGQVEKIPRTVLQHEWRPSQASNKFNSQSVHVSATTEPKVLNPCQGRPKPSHIAPKSSRPPSLYFLHIPKTAGTLMHHLVIQYANRTNGLACQFLYDGNRFGPEHYQMSVLPPPPFPNGSIEGKAIFATQFQNYTTKADLYRRGACRAVRGHVTYRQRDSIQSPLISFTVMRNPLERFVSMYEFVLMMVKTRPGETGWDRWLSGGPLHKEFSNASSIVNRGFYNEAGEWIARNNVGFSFHFYGVLHQLSGINPIFEGVGDPSGFGITNAKEMAERAKDNICGTHILGSQGNMNETLDTFFHVLEPYAKWTSMERQRLKSSSVNRNHLRKSRDVDHHLVGTTRKELERRLHYEMEVFKFAEDVIRYRKRSASNGS